MATPSNYDHLTNLPAPNPIMKLHDFPLGPITDKLPMKKKKNLAVRTALHKAKNK
jgi:hypothetical protein